MTEISDTTYTYTARSADDPRLVVTFTFYGDRMSVNLGAPLERLEETVKTLQSEEEMEEEPQKEFPIWLKPAGVSILQMLFRPFNVADVDAKFPSGTYQGLTIKAWVRTAGLKLIPIVFDWDRVDNPDAAKGFVNELKFRKKSSDHPGIFKGIFDYWFGWIGSLILALIFIKKLRRSPEREEA